MTPRSPLNRSILAAAALVLVPAFSPADVSLPAIISDHAVLQRGAKVPIWGWAEPGEEVTVSFTGQTVKTKAGADGRWQVKLERLKTGEAAELKVQGKNELTVKDVLVGEVWLCSGQSNMGFTVNRANGFEQEKAAANLPTLRHFKEGSGTATTPQEKGNGKWSVTTPEAVGTFSAAAYFFGRELNEKLKVPVGVINSSVGGTPIEAWTSWDAQKGVKDLGFIFAEWDTRIAAWDPAKAKADFAKLQERRQRGAEQAKAEGKPALRPLRGPVDPTIDAHRPANLFNGKIAPLIPYAIRGAIWYQGETNANTVAGGSAYAVQLPLLIADWRQRWGYEFPFAWVQLPEYVARSSDGWSLVQEAMLKSLSVPKTGMAVGLGLGEQKDIHPKAKKEVGQRLATWAMAKVYAPAPAKKAKAGPTALAMGPLFAAHQIKGGAVTITFKEADGLVAKDGEIKGFTIAGEDQVWKSATAKIEKDTVVVSSAEVAKPAAVRYAWGSNPEFSLVNAAGLPASPFRTDQWPIAETAPAAAAAAKPAAPAAQ